MSGHHDYLLGAAVLVLLVGLAALAVTALFSGKYRRRIGRAAAWTGGGLIGLYLVGRGIVEFFIIHYGDPASYQSSWGGPSLAGVFLVHSGPGFLILAGTAVYAWRRRLIRARRSMGRSGR